MLIDARVTLRDELESAVATLEEAGISTARVDAEWLLAGMLGVRRFDVYFDAERDLPAPVAAAYRAAVGRRARRAPLQQILGWEEFRGLRLRVTDAVLVPRPETETLVERALALLPPRGHGRRPLVIDVGTGSGCIACAIAHERADVDVIAIDVSPDAAKVALENVRSVGLSRRVRVLVGDLVGAIGAQAADLIVSNPPYLPTGMLETLPPEVAGHEPRVAFDGGADGLRIITEMVADARERLRPSGVLALETAGSVQAERVAALLGAAGFVDVIVRRDLAGVDRVVTGAVPAGSPMNRETR